MKTTELTNGQRVRLDNGWEADLLAAPGNRTIVLAMVHGIFAEAGSVYTAQITAVKGGDGNWQSVTPTATQRKALDANNALFGGAW